MAFRRTVQNIVALLGQGATLVLLVVLSGLALPPPPFRRGRARPSLAGTRRSSSNPFDAKKITATRMGSCYFWLMAVILIQT